MKKKTLALIMSAAMAVTMLTGCTQEEGGSGDSGSSGLEDIAQPIVVVDDPVDTTTDTSTSADTAGNTEQAEEKPSVVYVSDLTPPEGYVYSELTGLLIDESIADQRPLAVMVDNELTALDHYGVNDADIVYECMNSTANGRITRLMAIIKDYDAIERLGSVRSARTVNMILSAEWNAILCHDGGPYYIDEYYLMPEITHLNGVFSRIDNGKSREFTEYIVAADVDKYLGENATFDTEYNSYYTGAHFNFVESKVLSDTLDLNNYNNVTDVTDIYLPFPHNSSELHYNAETGLYEYYEYGSAHVDGATGEVLTFTNVILQAAEYETYDENGYLWYKIVNGSNGGYYLTGGECAEIAWYKGDMTANTIYVDKDINPITLNAGKTYIALVPADVWSELILK